MSPETLKKLEGVDGVVLGETHCKECGRKMTQLSDIPENKRNSQALMGVVGKCPTNSPEHHAINEGEKKKSSKK